jgi:hypothetical protein
MATDPIGGTVPLLRWPRMSTSPLRVALLQPSFSAAATMVVSPAKVPEPRGAYRSSAVPSYQGPLSIAVSSSARATSSILVSRAKFQKVLDIFTARFGRGRQVRVRTRAEGRPAQMWQRRGMRMRRRAAARINHGRSCAFGARSVLLLVRCFQRGWCGDSTPAASTRRLDTNDVTGLCFEAAFAW